MDRLDEIKARCDKATPGPWYKEGWALPNEDGEYIELLDDTENNGPANAAFISHAREDIPYLLAEVKRLNALSELDQIAYTQLNELYDMDIAELTTRAEKAEAERDKAVEDIPHNCDYCAHEGEDFPDNAPNCDVCMKPNCAGSVYCSGSNWKWKGKSNPIEWRGAKGA